jgi:hypothetical protein
MPPASAPQPDYGAQVVLPEASSIDLDHAAPRAPASVQQYRSENQSRPRSLCPLFNHDPFAKCLSSAYGESIFLSIYVIFRLFKSPLCVGRLRQGYDLNGVGSFFESPERLLLPSIRRIYDPAIFKFFHEFLRNDQTAANALPLSAV